MITTRADFDTAVAKAKTAAAYYDGETLEMTDPEYDALYDAIVAARTEHPDWDDQGLTTQVAGGASAGGDVRHPRRMLSLDKVSYDKDALDNMKLRLDYSNPAIAETNVSLGIKATAECDGNPCRLTAFSNPDPSANMTKDPLKIVWSN